MHDGRNFEKSNNFVGAITRLFSELNSFKVFIIIALILAALSSVLSIVAPNKLSDLTDVISEGLIVNTDNFESLNKKIYGNLQNIDINKILTSNDITMTEKSEIMNAFSSLNPNDSKSIITALNSLSDKSLEVVLPKIEIDNTIISSKDELKYIEVTSNMDKDTDYEDLYKKIDTLPKSIQKVIEPYMDINKIKKISLFLISLYIISSLFGFFQSFIMSTVSNNFAKSLRSKISIKINKLPLKFFDKNQTGDILSRVTNDVDTIAQTMNQSLATIVSGTTLFIGSLIMMFYTNYIMAITAILSSIIGFIFTFIILGRSQKYFKARQVELGRLNSHIEEVYSGLVVVKAYNGKENADKKFDECNNKVRIANQKSQFLSGIMMPMMSFIGNFGYVCVCVVGAILTMNNMITFGVIVAFITYVRLFTQPLTQIAQSLTNLQSTDAASERVFEFLDEEEMTSEDECDSKINKTKVEGNIVFNHVKFGYDEDKIIIKDFSAKVRKGQKIAIVGPTGAGKTTMVNLLMKFYEINSGDIKIDGVSLKKLKRDNIHEMFTMVLQDTWLFSGTIRENICFNRKNVSDKRIMEVCDTVGLSHFIKTLPKGLDTELSENDSISIGQKQLLTIARGMIEDSPFLILDEATSNVDTRTEELVQIAMDKLTEGKTSFIIAHRLSTIKNADLILVMNDGNIIEQGTHKELMKMDGFYKQLYNSQFEL